MREYKHPPLKSGPMRCSHGWIGLSAEEEDSALTNTILLFAAHECGHAFSSANSLFEGHLCG
jgi:hypothetical protein